MTDLRVELELWWLLALPLFFALGWVAARVDIRHVVRESRMLPRSYLRGLNFLVNEQPDRAIDAFLDAVQVEPETVELHYALGSLFRRRGETDRAIRMHQDLVEREGLDEEQRLLALTELGQDFRRAGLLDRAEEVFVRLRGTSQDEVATGALLDIYQQEQAWDKAIELATATPDRSSHLWSRRIAQFHCECAADDLRRSRFAESAQRIDAALAVNRSCVRASIIQGDLFLAQGDALAAIACWTRIEKQSPEFLSLVAGRLREAYVAAGRQADGLRLLAGFLDRYPALDLLDELFRWQLEVQGAEAAYTLVREALRRNPSLLGLEKLLEVQMLRTTDRRRADLDLVRNLIQTHTRKVARYACSQCGFKARQYHWRCPACGGWETFPPRRTEEFDLPP